MILQALAEFHRRLFEEGRAPNQGYQEKAIPFLLILDKGGNFRGITDTTSPEAKNGIPRKVPREEVRSGINAWQKANLLWDNPPYVLGYSESDPEEARRKHRSFIMKIKDYFSRPDIDVGVKAILAFLERGDFSEVYESPAWKAIKESGGYITFQLEGDPELICQREGVIKTISEREGIPTTPKVQCLVTGNLDTTVVTHGKTKGVKGAQTSGANIVSFNHPAFCSFGKEQGLNAPVGKTAEFAYTTAINTMLAKGSRQRILVGDATTVFWGERKTALEDLFADLFGEPAKENPEQLTRAMRDLYSAPASGAPPLDEDYTPFFVLGLAPNAARIAVRFWHAGTVGETARQIRRHFDDCAVVHGANQPEYLSLFRLLVSTAAQGKAENIAPNLGGDFMKAILAGTPYPLNLLSAAIRRCRAEREVIYPRAALIKGVLAREARYYQKTEKEVGMGLDPSNTNIGYRLGRLFAVLEKAQQEANPGINATIRDRFYGAASSNPVAAFPHLMKLKNHHLSKLENRGRAVNLEKIIEEIVGGIEDFPTHLNLYDQGRFAIGYYHQRQDFFKKHEPTTENL